MYSEMNVQRLITSAYIRYKAELRSIDMTENVEYASLLRPFIFHVYGACFCILHGLSLKLFLACQCRECFEE